MYTPGRPTGTERPVTVSPAVTWVTISLGICAPCTSLVRRAASSRAILTSGASPARAGSRASGGTRVVTRSMPSKRAVYSRTASAPRRLTSSQTGRICATAASTAGAARGGTPVKAVRLRLPGPRPRRSIREITCLVYGACPHPPSTSPSPFIPYLLPACPHAGCISSVGPGGRGGGPAGARPGQQDDDRGEHRPERERALGPQPERRVEEGPVRAGREQMVICPQPDVLADPEREQ